MKNITRTVLLLCIGFILVACSKEPEPPPPKPVTAQKSIKKIPQLRPVQTATSDLPTKPAYINSLMPVASLAYIRIPNPWAMLGTAKGAMFDKAIGSAPYVEAVKWIREGFGTNILPEFSAKTRELWALALLHIQSPTEALILPPVKAGAPTPELLISFASDFTDPQSLQKFLTAIAGDVPQLQVLKPINASGDGLIALAGMPVQVYFSTTDARIYFLGSLSPAKPVLSKRISLMKPVGQHPMFAMEKRMDKSGQGLFIWLNAPQILKVMGNMGQRDQTAIMAAFGASEVKSVALGIGTSGGIHRLMAVLEMPRVGFRNFIPLIDSKFEVSAAGKLDAVAIMGLPGPKDLTAIESMLKTSMAPEQMRKYFEAKQNMADKIGFSPEKILTALGPDVVFLFDEAGQYLAVRLNDENVFNAMLDQAVAKLDLKHTQQTIAGRTYHHLIIPSFAKLFSTKNGQSTAPQPRLLKRIVELPSHVFWTQEGNYLFVANVPQLLLDRYYIPQRTPVKYWLSKQQRLDANGALLLGSMRTQGLPRFVYHLNLQLLQFLGDLVGRPLDMFAFPSARELNLPQEAAYSFKLVSTASELSLEVDFENNPAEVLMTGNATAGVAVLGILAAVAIPAYQDYTLKAHVQVGVNAAMALRQKVGQFAMTNRRFPNATEATPVNSATPTSKDFALLLHPDSGRIVVTYSLEQLRQRKTLEFIPNLNGTQIQWKCVSDIARKFLPKVCR